MTEVCRVILRCDASPEIGAGHVTRCRALALALRDLGVEAVFAMREGAVDGFRWERTDDVVAVAGDVGAAWVVVDHYGVSAADLAALRDIGLHVGVIDDAADRDLTAVEWLLNQNVDAPAYDYRLSSGCVRLLGLDWAMLRPEFAAAREDTGTRVYGADDRAVLVSLGGGDVRAASARVVDGFDAVARDVRLRVVGEAGSPSSRHRLELPGRVSDMRAELLRADVVVSAAGSTCWEAMCLGVPVVVVPLNERQTRNARGIERAGAGVAVDRPEHAGVAAADLLADPQLRAKVSRAAIAAVDGRGAARAAASLVETMESAACAAG